MIYQINAADIEKYANGDVANIGVKSYDVQLASI